MPVRASPLHEPDRGHIERVVPINSGRVSEITYRRISRTVFSGPRHSEIPANVLKHMRMKSVLYSECGLKSLNDPADFDSPMRRFESSRPSQAFTASEKLAPRIAERPTISGLLRFGGPSPDSRIYRIGGQFAVSLRPLPRIFPFLGDWRRRLGSIATAWHTSQSDFAESLDFAGRSLGVLTTD
jgi:hypothetical protein